MGFSMPELDLISPAPFVMATAMSSLVGIPPSSGPNLAAGAYFGTLRGTALFLLGALLGSLASLLLVRTMFKAWLHRKMQRHEAKWRALDVAIAKEGALLIVVLLRLSPAMPISFVNALLGLASVGVVPFVLGTAVGLLPFSFVYAYVGAVGKQAAAGGQSTLDVALQVAGVVATLGLTYKISKVAQAALDGAQQQPVSARAGRAGRRASARLTEGELLSPTPKSPRRRTSPSAAAGLPRGKTPPRRRPAASPSPRARKNK